MGPQGSKRETAAPALLQISNEMVRIYKEHFGRGPTKAKSSFAGPDVLVCSLEDTFTPAERNLAALGEHQRLRDVRMFFQYASAAEFKEAVERVTGRQVRAFVSGIDTEKDVATEVFYLTPVHDGDGEVRAPDVEEAPTAEEAPEAETETV